LETTLEQGRLDLAALALESRVEARPEDLKAWEALAVVTALRDPSRVEAVIQRAFRSYPQGSDILDGLLRLYRRGPEDLSPAERAAQAGELLAAQGDWHLAAAAWTTALELEPDFPEARAFLGLARSKIGADGLADLQRAAAEAPGDPVVRMLLGQYWLGQGDASTALRELAYARGLAPGNPAFAATHASALAQAGRTADAAEAYQDAAEMDPQDATFWSLLAEFSLQHEFEIETLGRAAARNAAALSPGDASALATLGYMAHLGESSRLGEQLLARAIGLDPENPTAWYRYGLLLLDQGRFRESRTALAAAAALDAQGPIGRLALRSIDSVPVE
jgi:cytochrome c-type biogenesis protein CcmH/NrfG